MKSIFTLLLLTVFVTSALAQTPVEVTTGENYANDVYYSLENDVLKTSERNTWDIALAASQMSVSVLANNGAGVMVYTWPNGTISDWGTLDTTGMAWTPLYNSIVDWELGALNDNTQDGNELDYGWGTYNITTHNISGDSIFVLQLANGDFKKFAVEEKNAIQNIWTLKCADLDGQNDTLITINANEYADNTFIYYSLANNAVVEHEPTERWQLLFTRYFDINIPYYVSGVLVNSGVQIQQVDGVSQSDFEEYDLEMFNDTISQIGSDWKSFSMSTFQYDIASDVVYFVQDTLAGDNSVWKVYFTGFSGSSTGMYSFTTEKLNVTNIENLAERNLTVYPNPAYNEINVIHDFSGETEITVYNISGQPILKLQNNKGSGLNKQLLNISSLPKGMYGLQVRSGNKAKTVKFLKE